MRSLAFLVLGVVLLDVPAFGQLNFLKDDVIAEFNGTDMKMLRENVAGLNRDGKPRETRRWLNAETGHKGSVTYLEDVPSDDALCRRIRITNEAGARKASTAYLFCKDEHGEWKIKQ